MKFNLKKVGDKVKKKLTFKRATREDVYDILYESNVVNRNEITKLRNDLEDMTKAYIMSRDLATDALWRESDTNQKLTDEIEKNGKLEKNLSIAKATIELQKKEIEDLKSNRYLVKKVRATKGSKAEGAKQEIKVSTPKSATNSRVIKKVKE